MEKIEEMLNRILFVKHKDYEKAIELSSSILKKAYEESFEVQIYSEYLIKKAKLNSIFKLEKYNIDQVINNLIEINSLYAKIIENKDYFRLIYDTHIKGDSLDDLAKQINYNETKYLIEEDISRKSIVKSLFKVFSKKNAPIDKLVYTQREEEILKKIKRLSFKIDKLINLTEIFKDVKKIREDIFSLKYRAALTNKEIQKIKKLQESLTSTEKNFLLTVGLDSFKNNFKTNIVDNTQIYFISEDLFIEYKEILSKEFINISIKNVDGKHLISEIFKDNVFRLFIEYCEQHNILYVEDLKEEDFFNIQNIKGFGVGKTNKLIERYTEVMENNPIKINENEIINPIDFQIEILDEYKNFKVDILWIFPGINEKLIEQIKECGFITLESLIDNINDIKDLIPTLGTKKKENIILSLQQFNADKNILFKKLFNKVKENEYYIIAIERNILGKTLNEIGEERGITRERVRQKEKKINGKLEQLIMNFADIDMEVESVISLEEVLNLEGLSKDDIIILKGALKNEAPKNVTYIEGFDKFLINGNIEKLKKGIFKKVESFKDIIKISDLEKLSESFSIKIEISDLKNLLEASGYKEKSEYLIKGVVLKGKVYSIIMREYFKDGITFSNEEDMQKFKDILKMEFEMESETDRSIKAIIERNCIACDRGKYIYPDFVKVDMTLLDKIKEFILNNPQETLYTHQVYFEFEESLNKKNINNRYFLHGLLGYYYKDIFKFTKDTIWRGPKKQSKNYIFNNYIKDKGRIVTKAEMEEDLKGWTTIMFSLAIEECREVLKWNRGEYIHYSQLYFSKEEINNLESELEKILKAKESIASDEIFDVVKDKENLGLKENNVDTGFKLFSILLYFFRGKYKFKRPIIEKIH